MRNRLLDNTRAPRSGATDCAGVLGDVRLYPLMFGGHCFYVAKQLRGTAIDGDPNRREVGGIELPQCYRLKTVTKTGEELWSPEADVQGRTCYVKVLAKGPNVGKLCDKHHAKLYRRPRWLADRIVVGDLLLCPNTTDIGIRQSPICDYEYFIEEYIPFLKVISRNMARFAPQKDT